MNRLSTITTAVYECYSLFVDTPNARRIAAIAKRLEATEYDTPLIISALREIGTEGRYAPKVSEVLKIVRARQSAESRPRAKKIGDRVPIKPYKRIHVRLQDVRRAGAESRIVSTEARTRRPERGAKGPLHEDLVSLARKLRAPFPIAEAHLDAIAAERETERLCVVEMGKYGGWLEKGLGVAEWNDRDERGVTMLAILDGVQEPDNAWRADPLDEFHEASP